MAIPNNHDSLSKISQGLDERRRLREGLAKSPLAGLLNAPRSSASVQDMLGKAKLKATRYSEWADGLHEKLAKLRTDKEAEAEKIPGLRQDQRAQIVKLAVAAERERLRTEGPDAEMFKDRNRIRAEFNEMVRLLGEVKADFESNIGALNRATLGSENRRAFAADVANAGPQDIDGYLREAIKRGGNEGRAMASAVFARMDYLSEHAPEIRNRCTVSKGEIAEVLIGSECAASLKAIEEAQILHEEISMTAAELDGRQVAQLARDSLRMRKHNFAEKYPETKPKEGEQL
jgi:hypothetical protein